MQKLHEPTQNKDGSIYCYCQELPDQRVSMSINWLTRTLMCSVCRFQVKE